MWALARARREGRRGPSRDPDQSVWKIWPETESLWLCKRREKPARFIINSNVTSRVPTADEGFGKMNRNKAGERVFCFSPYA